MSMTFEESVRSGLRIEGSETDDEGIRHRRRYQWAIDKIKALIASGVVDSKATVVDYGCGSGYGVRMLNEADIECVGYDPDPAAVKYAVEHWGIEATARPPSADEYDITLCHGVIEHIESCRPASAVRMLTRLAKSGYFVGFVPYKERANVNPHHCWCGLDESILAGLVPISIEYEPLDPNHPISSRPTPDCINFLWVVQDPTR